MSPSRPIRQPVRTLARMLRVLRVLLCGGLLAGILGGGDCHWAFSSNTSGDNGGDGATVIVTDDTVGDGAPEPDGEAAIDPALLELGECVVELATDETDDDVAASRAAGGAAALPLFQRALPPPPRVAFAGISPARIWPAEAIGEAELAAFATALLDANEEVLHLPGGAAALRYLETQVAEGGASVRFAEQSADADHSLERGARGGPLLLAVRFGPGGELVAIERLGDKSPDRR